MGIVCVGVDVQAEGDTALIVAAHNGYTDIVNSLLASGADVTIAQVRALWQQWVALLIGCVCVSHAFRLQSMAAHRAASLCGAA